MGDSIFSIKIENTLTAINFIQYYEPDTPEWGTKYANSYY